MSLKSFPPFNTCRSKEMQEQQLQQAQQRKVPKRIARTVINALRGGVVPRIGLPWIAVGRRVEIEALLADIDTVAEGGAAMRIVTGRYGSGKSFLLQTIRAHAMDRNFVVADADLSPDRRLQGTKGQGLATWRELMQNLATRTMPEGGALALILERWMKGIQAQLASNGMAEDCSGYFAAAESEIRHQIAALEGVVHGFEVSAVLIRYFHAFVQGDDDVRGAVLKWLRGEYTTRAEAKAALGVNLIVADDNWYDFLKILALLLKGAGYAGLIVLIDELVNLSKIPNSISRQYNYEKILMIYNDVLQGRAHYLGVVMGGTPQAVEDPRRGLYSYEALRSRLANGRFSVEGRCDMRSPVIQLKPLTPEELLVLVEKLEDMHASLYGTNDSTRRLSETDLAHFLEVEFDREGANTHITPREIIRDFIEALDLLAENPDLTPEKLFTRNTFESFSTLEDAAEESATSAPQYAEFTL